MTTLLAYVPFLKPALFLHDIWYLLVIPLALGISIIYKAMREETLEGFWMKVFIMTTQIVLAMIGLAIALTLLVQVIIPMLPAE